MVDPMSYFLRSSIATLKDPTRIRMFVQVTMDLGIDRSMIGLHGPRRIRKKKLKKMFRQAAVQTVLGAVWEEQKRGAEAKGDRGGHGAICGRPEAPSNVRD